MNIATHKDIWHYPRTQLAEQVIGLFNSGLSHALTFFAPRRKGKTEFLLKDIAPLAKDQDYQVFYFSFLDNGNDTLRRFIFELNAFSQGKIAKALSQLSSVEIQGFKAELNQMGNDDLLHAVSTLATHNRPTLLLLDEIQALAGASHQGLIASLRTALDTNKDKIKVIFTGSSRENLRLMFSSSTAPFFHYGQNLNFPDLDKSFTDHLAGVLYQTTKRDLDNDELYHAFCEMNKSPQMARALIERMALNPSLDIATAKDELLSDLQSNHDYLLTYQELTALQQHLLRHIATGQGEMYSQATKEHLTRLLGVDISNANIQSSIRSLSKKGLLFRASNGVYEIDDPFFKDWLLSQ